MSPPTTLGSLDVDDDGPREFFFTIIQTYTFAPSVCVCVRVGSEKKRRRKKLFNPVSVSLSLLTSYLSLPMQPRNSFQYFHFLLLLSISSNKKFFPNWMGERSGQEHSPRSFFFFFFYYYYYYCCGLIEYGNETVSTSISSHRICLN